MKIATSYELSKVINGNYYNVSVCINNLSAISET